MDRRPVAGSFLLVAVLLLFGCQGDEGRVSSVAESITVPAAPGSGQPHLAVGTDGRVWMSWIEPTSGDQHALRYATLVDTSWTDPQTVARGTDWFVNWADVPSLQPLPTGRLAAHYLRSNGPSSLAYAVQIAQTDGAETWQPAVTPHDDGTETEHGFASLLPWSKSRLLAVWLDGRKTAGSSGHQGEMTLRGAVIDSSGTVEHRALLDDRTCECCPTSAVRAGDEALVAYRDRSEKEVRNIRLVRFNGQSWSEPMLLHDDGWRIAGCPVNGPALAVQKDRVAAAWFTAAGGTPRVKVSVSTDGGQTFGEPVIAAEGGVEGRVDLVLLGDGTAVVNWLGRDGETPALRARPVGPEGERGAATTIATLPSTSRGVGMPKMVRAREHLYASWTDPEAKGGSKVRVVRFPVGALR